MSFKQPVSVLVVIHTPSLEILLLERASHAGYWQSVTGSHENGESLIDTAQREVVEETGIVAPVQQFTDWRMTNTFEIFAEWRSPLRAGCHAQHRARFLTRTAEATARSSGARRTSGLPVATLARSRSALLFLEQP